MRKPTRNLTQLDFQMLAIKRNIAHAPLFFLEAQWYLLGQGPRGDPFPVISILYKPKQL